MKGTGPLGACIITFSDDGPPQRIKTSLVAVCRQLRHELVPLIAATLRLYIGCIITGLFTESQLPRASIAKPPSLYAQSIREIKVHQGTIHLFADWSKEFPSLQLLIQRDGASFSDVEELTESNKKEILSQNTMDRVRRDALAYYKKNQANLKGGRSFRYQMELSFGEFNSGDYYSLMVYEEETGHRLEHGEHILFV